MSHLLINQSIYLHLSVGAYQCDNIIFYEEQSSKNNSDIWIKLTKG